MQEMQETQIWCLGRGDTPGVGNGNPLQDSCLGNSMDRGRSLVATTHGVAKIGPDWLSTQHTHYSFYNISLLCLGKLHSYTSSRSLSPDLRQATIHLNNWPISKVLSVECLVLPALLGKGCIIYKAGSVCQGHCYPGSIFHLLIRNRGRYYFHFWVKISELFWKKLLSIEWQYFSSVQFSCSVVSDYLQPHESQHARPPCPTSTPRVYSNSCPLSWWCHPAIPSSVIPFSSCPQSLPASGSFPKSQLFTWGGQSIGVSASASVLPMNTQDWSPLGCTGCISLQSKGLSRVFSNTTVQNHQFFSIQLSSQSNSHIHTWPLEKP